MKKDLYIVRGTGMAFDGVLVEIIDVEGDFVLVSPPHSKNAPKAIMVDRRYLQEVDDKTRYKYTFTITKVGDTDNSSDGSIMFTVDEAIRNVSLETIRDFINSNLSPILRMDK